MGWRRDVMERSPIHSRSGPLRDIRVVEAASYVSGPLATMMLSDLGAEVIKVETPTGDPYRRFGRPRTAFSPHFASCNRGKRSVTVDLASASGREQMLALLETADVLVSNWRASVGERFGL